MDPDRSAEPTTAAPDVTITVCPDGPLLLRGPAALLDTDGTVVDAGRRTVALCRCGGTGNPPFCDATHKRGRRRSSTT